MPDWPHAPVHQLGEQGAYVVTGGTYHKLHFFARRDRLSLVHDQLLSLAGRYGWRLQAWAVFSNHYHFVALSPENPATLRELVGHLHAATARDINALDGAAGRRVWFNYWETHLTYEAQLPRPPEVRARERRASWAGSRRSGVPLVLRSLVRGLG